MVQRKRSEADAGSMPNGGGSEDAHAEEDDENVVVKRRSGRAGGRHANKKQQHFAEDENINVDEEEADSSNSTNIESRNNRVTGGGAQKSSARKNRSRRDEPEDEEAFDDDYELIADNTGRSRRPRAVLESNVRERTVKTLGQLIGDDEGSDGTFDSEDDRESRASDVIYEPNWDECENGRQEFEDIFGATVEEFERKEPAEKEDDEDDEDAEEGEEEETADASSDDEDVTKPLTAGASVFVAGTQQPVSTATVADKEKFEKVTSMPGRMRQYKFNPQITDEELIRQANWIMHQRRLDPKSGWQEKPQQRLFNETLRILQLMHRELLEPDFIYWYQQQDADNVEPENVGVLSVRAPRPQKSNRHDMKKKSDIVDNCDADEPAENASGGAANGQTQPVTSANGIVAVPAGMDGEAGDIVMVDAPVAAADADGDSEMVEQRYDFDDAAAPEAAQQQVPAMAVDEVDSGEPTARLHGDGEYYDISSQVASLKLQQPVPAAAIGGGWDEEPAAPASSSAAVKATAAAEVDPWGENPSSIAALKTSGGFNDGWEENPTAPVAGADDAGVQVLHVSDINATLRGSWAPASDPTALGGDRPRLMTLDDLKEIAFLNYEYQTIETDKKKIRARIEAIRQAVVGKPEDYRKKIDALLPTEAYVNELPNREEVDDVDKSLLLLGDFVNPIRTAVTKSGHKRRIRQCNAATRSGWTNYARSKEKDIDKYFGQCVFGNFQEFEAALKIELKRQTGSDPKKAAAGPTQPSIGILNADEAGGGADTTQTSGGNAAAGAMVETSTGKKGRKQVPSVLRMVRQYNAEYRLTAASSDLATATSDFSFQYTQIICDAMQTCAHEICTRPRVRRFLRNALRSSKASRVHIMKSPRETKQQLDDDLNIYTHFGPDSHVLLGDLKAEDIIKIECGRKKGSVLVKFPELRQFVNAAIYQATKRAAHELYACDEEEQIVVKKTQSSSSSAAQQKQSSSSSQMVNGAAQPAVDAAAEQVRKPRARKVLPPIVIRNYGDDDDPAGYARQFVEKRRRRTKNAAPLMLPNGATGEGVNGMDADAPKPLRRHRKPIQVATWANLRIYVAILATNFLEKTLESQLWQQAYTTACNILYYNAANKFRSFISARPMLSMLEKVPPGKLNYYDTEPLQNTHYPWYSSTFSEDRDAATFDSVRPTDKTANDSMALVEGGAEASAAAAAAAADPWGAPDPVETASPVVAADVKNEEESGDAEAKPNVFVRTCVMGIMLEDTGFQGTFAATVVDKFGTPLAYAGPLDVNEKFIQTCLAHEKLLALVKRFQPILIVVSGTGPLAANIVANLKFLRQGRAVDMTKPDQLYWPKLACAVQLARPDVATWLQQSMLTRDILLDPKLLSNDLAVRAWGLCLESIEPCLPYALLFDEKILIRYVKNMDFLYDKYREELKHQTLLMRMESEMVSVVATRGLAVNECRSSSCMRFLLPFIPGFHSAINFSERHLLQTVALRKAIESPKNRVDSRESLRALSHKIKDGLEERVVKVFPNDASYRNAVSFLRFRPSSDDEYRIDDEVHEHEVLDRTRIHPDMYKLACKVVKAAFEKAQPADSKSDADLAAELAALPIGELLDRVDEDPSLLAKRDLKGMANHLLNTGEVAQTDLWQVQFILNELCYPFKEMRSFPIQMPSWDDLYFWRTGKMPKEHEAAKFSATVNYVDHERLVREYNGRIHRVIRNEPAEIYQKVKEANELRKLHKLRDFLCPYCHRAFQSEKSVGKHILDTLEVCAPEGRPVMSAERFAVIQRERNLCPGSFRLAILTLHNGFTGVIVRALRKNTKIVAVNKLFNQLELNRTVTVRIDDWTYNPSHRTRISGNKQAQLTVVSDDSSGATAETYREELQKDPSTMHLAEFVDMQHLREQAVWQKIRNENAKMTNLVHHNNYILFCFGSITEYRSSRGQVDLSQVLPVTLFEDKVRSMRLLLSNYVGYGSVKRAIYIVGQLVRIAAEQVVRQNIMCTSSRCAGAESSTSNLAKNLYLVIPLLNYALVCWAYIMPKEYGDHAASQTPNPLDADRAKDYAAHSRVQLDWFVIIYQYDATQFSYFLPEHDSQIRLLDCACSKPRQVPGMFAATNIIGYSSELYKIVSTAIEDRKAIFECLVENSKGRNYEHLYLAPQVTYWPMYAIVKQLMNAKAMETKVKAECGDSAADQSMMNTSTAAARTTTRACYAIAGREDLINSDMMLLWTKRCNMVVKEPIKVVLNSPEPRAFTDARTEAEQAVSDGRRAIETEAQRKKKPLVTRKIPLEWFDRTTLELQFRGEKFDKLMTLLRMFKKKSLIEDLFNPEEISQATDGKQIIVWVPEGRRFLGIISTKEDELSEMIFKGSADAALPPAAATTTVDGWAEPTAAENVPAATQETLEGGWGDAPATTVAPSVPTSTAVADGWADDPMPAGAEAATLVTDSAADVKRSAIRIELDSDDANDRMKTLLTEWLRGDDVIQAREFANDANESQYSGNNSTMQPGAVVSPRSPLSPRSPAPSEMSFFGAASPRPPGIDADDNTSMDGSVMDNLLTSASGANTQQNAPIDDLTVDDVEADIVWQGLTQQQYAGAMLENDTAAADDDDEAVEFVEKGGFRVPAPIGAGGDGEGRGDGTRVRGRGRGRGGRGGRGGYNNNENFDGDSRGRGRGRGRGGRGRGGGRGGSSQYRDMDDGVDIGIDANEMATLNSNNADDGWDGATSQQQQPSKSTAATRRFGSSKPVAAPAGDTGGWDLDADDGVHQFQPPPDIFKKHMAQKFGGDANTDDDGFGASSSTQTADGEAAPLFVPDNTCPAKAGKDWATQGPNADPTKANRLWHLNADEVPPDVEIPIDRSASATGEAAALLYDADGNVIPNATPLHADGKWGETGPNRDVVTANRYWGAENIPEIAERLQIPIATQPAVVLPVIGDGFSTLPTIVLAASTLPEAAADVADWGNAAGSSGNAGEYQFPAPPKQLLAKMSGKVVPPSSGNSAGDAIVIDDEWGASTAPGAMQADSTVAGGDVADWGNAAEASGFAPPPAAVLEKYRGAASALPPPSSEPFDSSSEFSRPQRTAVKRPAVSGANAIAVVDSDNAFANDDENAVDPNNPFQPPPTAFLQNLKKKKQAIEATEAEKSTSKLQLVDNHEPKDDDEIDAEIEASGLAIDEGDDGFEMRNKPSSSKKTTVVNASDASAFNDDDEEWGGEDLVATASANKKAAPVSSAPAAARTSTPTTSAAASTSAAPLPSSPYKSASTVQALPVIRLPHLRRPPHVDVDDAFMHDLPDDEGENKIVIMTLSTVDTFAADSVVAVFNSSGAVATTENGPEKDKTASSSSVTQQPHPLGAAPAGVLNKQSLTVHSTQHLLPRLKQAQQQPQSVSTAERRAKRQHRSDAEANDVVTDTVTVAPPPVPPVAEDNDDSDDSIEFIEEIKNNNPLANPKNSPPIIKTEPAENSAALSQVQLSSQKAVSLRRRSNNAESSRTSRGPNGYAANTHEVIDVEDDEDDDEIAVINSVPRTADNNFLPTSGNRGHKRASTYYDVDAEDDDGLPTPQPAVASSSTGKRPRTQIEQPLRSYADDDMV